MCSTQLAAMGLGATSPKGSVAEAFAKHKPASLGVRLLGLTLASPASCAQQCL